MKAEEVKIKIINNFLEVCKLPVTKAGFAKCAKLDKESNEIIEQYADKESREVAVDFELRHVYKGASKSAKKLAYMQFDEWKSKQEEQ